MNDDTKSLICPFCEEGALKTVKCKKCGMAFLQCDECESVYKDRDSLEENYGPECPHCGVSLD